MSSYYGVGRTNDFAVTNLEGLKKALEPFPHLQLHAKKFLDNTLACILDISDCGDFSCEDDDCNEFSFEEHVLPYMDKECVLVVMHSGARCSCSHVFRRM